MSTKGESTSLNVKNQNTFSRALPAKDPRVRAIIRQSTIEPMVYKSPSSTSIVFNCLPVIPMDWSMANSLFLTVIPVSMALKKLSMPMRAMIKDKALPSSINILVKPLNSSA